MSKAEVTDFLKAYAKFGCIVIAGFAIAFLLGVPLDLVIRLAAGAILTFVVAFKVARENFRM
jgi:hypothetical protein